MHDFRPHVRRAAELLGGQAKLAAAIGTVQSEISRLSTTAKSIPPDTAIAISKATGGKVPLSDLIPDVVTAVAQELSAGAAA